MFSEDTVKIIKGLKFDPAAKIIYCALPLGSIYWSDELPATTFFGFKNRDGNLILKLFGIRIKYWVAEAVSGEEEALWDSAKKQVPEWAFFRRLELTPEQRSAHENAQNDLLSFFEQANSILGDNQE